MNEGYQFTAFAIGISPGIILDGNIDVFMVPVGKFRLSYGTKLKLDFLSQETELQAKGGLFLITADPFSDDRSPQPPDLAGLIMPLELEVTQAQLVSQNDKVIMGGDGVFTREVFTDPIEHVVGFLAETTWQDDVAQGSVHQSLVTG